MTEYRELRSRVGFLELCRNPALVAEVTAHAATWLGVDAAILFADLLLPLEPLGLRVTFEAGDGPSVTPPVRDKDGVSSLRPGDPCELGYVWEAVAATRAALPTEMPLIGFAGAPFTVASYAVEGGGSRHFAHTKRLLFADPGAWAALLDRITDVLIPYLLGQIDAGVDVIQLFDSWVGALSPRDYRVHAAPWTRRIVDALRAHAPQVPVIHFGTGTGLLLEDMQQAGGTVIGIDATTDFADARRRLGPHQAVMGNLDPVVLLAGWEATRERAEALLGANANRPGHVFNLGHGILPNTDPELVRRLVHWLHERTST
jgi:uroporphyrinogen decarboxylase